MRKEKKPISLIACQRPAKLRVSYIRNALECSLQKVYILTATRLKHEELSQTSLDYSYSRMAYFPGN